MEYIAALDISKAFDCFKHFKLLNSLQSAGIPAPIVSIICNWYSKLFSVRWNNCLSESFSVGNRIRLRSLLSLILFDVINIYVFKFRHLWVGCFVKSVFLGCIIYADDIILFCPSVHGLQEMLAVCFETS